MHAPAPSPYVQKPPPPNWSTPRPADKWTVGRNTELGQLDRHLEQSFGGRRQIVFVSGEPGIGKTTLVNTFLEQRLNNQEIWISRGQCLAQYGAGEPCLTLLEAVEHLQDSIGDRQLHLSLLRQYAPAWCAQLPSLIAPTERTALQRDQQGMTPQPMLREFAAFIEALSNAPPVAIVIEDLHWSDHSTLDVMSYLAQRQQPARLLLLGTFCPVEVAVNAHPLQQVLQELQLRQQCDNIALDFLSRHAIQDYLIARFGRDGQHGPEVSPLASELAERTRGNPLFIEHIVEEMIRQGRFVLRADGWSLQMPNLRLEFQLPSNSWWRRICLSRAQTSNDSSKLQVWWEKSFLPQLSLMQLPSV